MNEKNSLANIRKCNHILGLTEPDKFAYDGGWEVWINKATNKVESRRGLVESVKDVYKRYDFCPLCSCEIYWEGVLKTIP